MAEEGRILVSLATGQKVFLLLISLPILAGLMMIFKSYALAFWGLGVGILLLAVTMPAKELHAKDRTLFWLIIPVILVVTFVGCIASFFLSSSLGK